MSDPTNPDRVPLDRPPVPRFNPPQPLANPCGFQIAILAPGKLAPIQRQPHFDHFRRQVPSVGQKACGNVTFIG